MFRNANKLSAGANLSQRKIACSYQSWNMMSTLNRIGRFILFFLLVKDSVFPK